MCNQGGGNGQFSATAMNFMNLKPNKSADYLVTGYWSDRAALEAKKYGNVNLVLGDHKKFNSKTHKNYYTLLYIKLNF